MKTILAPTDFSSVSENVINYAADFAAAAGAKLILFHAYHPVLVNTEVPVVAPTMEDLEKDSMQILKAAADKLIKKFAGKLSVECICKCGFAVDEIEIFVKENKTDLVIAGMQGAGLVVEKLIGSVTTDLMRKLTCPVLAVDKTSKFNSIKKIALACDYQKTDNTRAFAPLKELVKLFKSHIYIVNVVSESVTTPTSNEAIEGIKLDHTFEGIDHTFLNVQNSDVVAGINDFVSRHQIDLVVMIPREHSILNKIFREPKTKQMAFHTQVPLLTLHN